MAKARFVEQFDFDNEFSTGENFSELLENSEGIMPKEGSVVKGRIISLRDDFAIVDIGFKNEGIISVKDFPPSERERVAEGDTIDVFLEKIDNSKAETIISRERAVREENWEKLEEKFENGEQVEGSIFSRVKGGFTVDLDGTVAFLPGSQVDVRPVKNVDPLMDIRQPFIILKMDRRRGNIVVSRRAILEESLSVERDKVLASIQEGVTLDGVVKNITDYGAFVDLGAVDGLLHVTDISWKRINHPSEALNVGDDVKVKVIKFDQRSGRISLGMKQLEHNPWQEAAGKYQEGQRLKGKISSVTDYGAFVTLDDGIEGLIHVSEMSWTRKNIHPNKVVNEGDEVDVVVLSVEVDKERLSLGMKQCTENPWTGFAAKVKRGDIMDGVVENITDFGLFVNLQSDIEGLVHASDISYDLGEADALKSYKTGDKVKVKILEIDSDKERISLGIKQLESDSRADNSSYKRDGAYTFTVKAISDKGVTVEIEDGEGQDALIKKSDLSKDRVECRPERFSVGDRVDAKVVGFDGKGLPRLSIKALETEEEKKAIAQFGSADSGASLGGILGVALEQAQAEAKANEKNKK